MAYTPDAGGSGGGYAERTHRELNAYVGSVSYLDLSEIRNTWHNTGSQALQVAELIETKLEQLTAASGWTGPGAEAFARVIRHDLITPLRDYARRSGGFSREGEQRVGHAADMDVLIETISGSYSTAGGNNIPWDVDSDWEIRRKEVDQSLFGKIDELVTGEDEDYEKAKSNAPYEIVNGQGQVIREIPKEQFELVEESVPANPNSPVYPRTDTTVANDVDRFDRIMQGLAIGSSPRSNVQSAAVDVDAALRDYAPAEVEEAELTTSRETSGPDGSGPGGPGGGTGGPGGPRIPPTVPETGGPDVGGPETGGPDFGGPETGGPDFGGPETGGPQHPITGIGPVDGQPGHLPGGPGTGGLPGAGTGPDFGGTGGPAAAPELAGAGGTSAAGAAPIATAGVGGIGAGPSAGAAAVNVGAAPGVGGMGNLAPVALNPGRAGTSFSMGADGRPRINTGSVGSFAGSGGPGSSPAGAAGGAGTEGGRGAGGPGAGGAGAPAPLPGARRNDRGKEESETELEETWLEEDRSIWGGRAGAPPSEIR